MATRLFCGFTALALAVLTTGCSSTGETFRGQSPAGLQNAGYFGPRNGPITQTQHCESCPPGASNGACGPAGCGPGCGLGMNMPCNPVHRNYYNVRMPKDLRYPTPNTPMAVVQYPYYTTKGPSDFFMK